MAKRKPNEEKKGLDEWMSTYGDMMTLLLCFFVLLFSMSTVDTDKLRAVVASFSNTKINMMENTSPGTLEGLGNGILEMPEVEGDSDKEHEIYEQGAEELQKMASDFRTYYAENGLDGKIDVEQNDQYITLSFNDGVLFDSGRAELRSDALNALGIVADELMKYPENDIKIEGHTDNRPINTVQFPNNWYLSAARAISVALFFTETKQFEPTRISTEGYGEYRPKVPNDTPENRSVNRRVEIKIVSKYFSNEDI